jgi:hypothetical protein
MSGDFHEGPMVNRLVGVMLQICSSRSGDIHLSRSTVEFRSKVFASFDW